MTLAFVLLEPSDGKLSRSVPRGLGAGNRAWLPSYTLWREWIGGNGFVMFIGLNPSTADETTDDPTIRRCIGFAKRWGFEALCMTNLFAFRATDPNVMMAASDPVGPDNDRWLRQLSNDASLVVAAWGVGGTHMQRDRIVLEQVVGAMDCLGKTKAGHPRHPLYVRSDVERVDFMLSNVKVRGAEPDSSAERPS